MPKPKKQEIGAIQIDATMIEKDKDVVYFPDTVCNELAKAVGDDAKLFEFIDEEQSSLINHCDNANVLLLSVLIKEVKKIRILLEGLSGKLDSSQKSNG
jgi:hypothetical protein